MVATDTTVEQLQARIDSLEMLLNATHDLLGSSPAVLLRWRVAAEWSVEFVSESVRQFGYTADELLSGQITWRRIIHPDDAERVQDEIDNAARRRSRDLRQQYRILTKTGELRWVDCQLIAVLNANQRVTHFQGLILDITTYKQAEEALREENIRQQSLTQQQEAQHEHIAAALQENEAKFRAIFECSPIGIVVGDQYGYLVESNPAFQRMIGYSAEELWSKTISEITHPDDIKPSAEMFAEIAARKCVTFQLEKRYIRKDQEIIWGRATASLLLGGANPQRYSIALIEDITEQKMKNG